MKKILVILVSSILPLFVSAYDFEFNGMYFNYLELVGQEQDDGIATYICNVELTNKEGGMGGSFVQTLSGDLVIPDSFIVSNGPLSQYKCYVTRIGDNALANAYNITSLTIPASIKTIGLLGLFPAMMLNKVTIYATEPPSRDTSYALFRDEIYDNAILYVPYGCKDKYVSSPGWSSWNRFNQIVELEKEGDKLNGHEYVDLGLPSGKCWATMNYGATSPDDYGSFEEWSFDDIIFFDWGEEWRTPSIEDIHELIEYCTWTWGSKNGINGYIVTGKTGNSIFIPACGYELKNYLYSEGECTYYWCSTYVGSISPQSDEMASVLMCTSTNISCGQASISAFKLPIRPVTRYSQDTVDENVFEGEGTRESPYIIGTAEDLNKLAKQVNNGNSYKGSYFVMNNDIDLSEVPFEPIGCDEDGYSFSGNFDGNGFVIKGLSISGGGYLGLFGCVNEANINNVGLIDEYIEGGGGGIVYLSINSTITNCFTHGKISGSNRSWDRVGAIVGLSENTIIQNCFSSMQNVQYQINGYVGGLVGENRGIIENCYYYGTINAKVYDKRTTGGIVGYNDDEGSIRHCYYIREDFMNNDFEAYGSQSRGNCYNSYSFNLYGITISGSYLYELLNSWVLENSNMGHYRKWTNESFPTFREYSVQEENDEKEFVDLGLPSGLLWATKNVGANQPEDYGDYFAWAETTPKTMYDWSTYKYANGSDTSLTKYCTSSAYGIVDYLETLEEEDDAASVNWGLPWRTPTLSETQELINYCEWSFSNRNGINGYEVTGPNGNSIFFPAAGIKEYDMVFFNETDVCVQSSTIFNAANGKPSSASVLYCENGTPHYWYGWNRCWGYPVRPVMNNNSNGIFSSRERTEDIIGIFDAQGHKLNGFHKGLNIIKYKNGISKKVVR